MLPQALTARQRWLVLLLALDHLALVLLTLGNCRRGEYVSSAAYALKRDGKWQGRVAVAVIDWIFAWAERDHCFLSWQAQQHLYGVAA